MQPQVSSAPAAVPTPPRPTPQIVQLRPRKPPRKGIWLLLGFIALAGIVAFIKLGVLGASSRASKAQMEAVRTVPVRVRDVEKTLRITGVIGAENFAAIIAPKIQGSRRDMGRMRSGGGGGGGSSSSSTTSSSSSSSSSTSTPSPSTSSPSLGGGSSSSTTSGASSGSVTSTGIGANTSSTTSSLGALRGTTNRFGDRASAMQSGTSSSSSNTSATSTPTSSAMGPSGLGSTSNTLIGGGQTGGGGGGGSTMVAGEFMLVLMRMAKPGSHVKKGDMVAEFDRQYQLNRLDDYRAAVIQAAANVKKLRADLAVAKEAHDQLVRAAKADWDKALLDLKTIEVRSAIESEEFKLAAQEAEARYKELVGEIKQLETSQAAQLRMTEIDRDRSKIELLKAEANVNRMVMRTPIDGIVVMQTIWRSGDMGQVQEGDMIYPGMYFMQIVDPSSMVVNATINQVDAEALRIGMKATVRLDAYPDMALPGHIFGIGAMTNAGFFRPTYMREIPVRLKLDRMDARVIPDLSASADVVLASERQATVAPLESVFYDNGKPFVFLRSPSGWERREVELGLKSNVAAVVRSGLHAGEVLAAQQPQMYAAAPQQRQAGIQ